MSTDATKPGNIRLWALTAVVLMGLAASLAANWPGHFPPDALWQLGQGRSGVFNDWHPPVMAWLLGLADRLVPGAPLFIVLDGVLFYGGLLAFAALKSRPSLTGLAVTALLAVSPAVLVFQGLVVKDVLFADAVLAGFAALAWAGRCWARPRLRFGLIVLALVLLALGALTRQNGFVAPICGAVALGAIAWMRRTPAPGGKTALARSVGWAAAALAVSGSIAGAGALALHAHSDGEPANEYQLKRLQVYDLAGAVHLDPAVDLAILHRDQPDLEGFIRDEAAPSYSASGADNLAALPGGAIYLIPDGPAAGRQWGALIAEHPWLYLRTRARAFLTTLTARQADGCPIYFVGVDPGSPALLKGAGLTARYDAKDRWDGRFAKAFEGTPVFSHLAYGALLLVLMAMAARGLMGRRDRDGALATLALGATALLFALSFLVISNACDYRYLYLLDVAAMAALARQASRFPALRD